MSTTPFPLGAYLNDPNGSDPSAEAQFESDFSSFTQLMGAAPQYLDYYVDQTQPISSWAANASWTAWSAAQSPDAKDTTPVIGLPMASTASSLTADQQYQAFASGQYDSAIEGVVESWAQQGFTTQYWRPGWEMNLTSSPSYAGSDAQTQADWVAAFQHISTVLHQAGAADGVNVQVVWNPSITNYSLAGNATQTLYPGNQYVDVIGADVYGDLHPYGNQTALYDWDKSGQELNSPNPVYDSSIQQWASDPVNLMHYYTDPASTQYSEDGSDGHNLSLQGLIDFAKAQGKPLAIAETGAGSTSDGANVPDNPTFVQWLSNTLENSGVPVDFVNLWDSNGGGNYEFSNASDGKPQEAAAWAQYFGAQGTSSTTPPATPPTTPTAPATITLGSGSDTIALQMSEDAYQGDAQFTVSVDGTQIGGTQTITASHATGQTQTVDVDGNFGSGQHTVSVDFLNDLFGGTTTTDRNLYVNNASYDGTAVAGATLNLMSSGTQSFTIPSSDPASTTPAPITLGSGSDTIALQMSEDAYQGDAQFTVNVDGTQIGGTQTVTASHAAGQTQTVNVDGNFGPGQHIVSVDFLNDLYAGTPTTDRNLYVDSATVNGNSVPNAQLSLLGSGTQTFDAVIPTSATNSLDATTSSTTYTPGAAGGTITTTGNDTVQVGSGDVTVNASGPSVTVNGGSGALTFLAGSGSATITGGTGSLNFTEGSGTATVTAGSGNDVFNFVNGSAGGSLVINDFVPGTDTLNLQGYQGSGIASEQVSGGSTNIVLADNTHITLAGVTATNSLFA